MASAWLIRNWIDREAAFGFIDEKEIGNLGKEPRHLRHPGRGIHARRGPLHHGGADQVLRPEGQGRCGISPRSSTSST
ncbi:MAG: chromate resistance protein [Desulfobacterales bacterium]|nr:chromate resistance protein [Desulfobacterales bacterium]